MRMFTIYCVGVERSQIFAGSFSLFSPGAAGWLPGIGQRVRGMIIPPSVPNHQSSSCPSAPLRPLPPFSLSAPRRIAGRWRREGEWSTGSRPQRCSHLARDWLWVCAFGCSMCGRVCSLHWLYHLFLFVCQRFFFSSLIFADKAGAAKCFVMCEYICASVRVETEKKRERVWASRRQRSRFERFTWLRFVPSKTPTSQICCS